MPVMDSLSLPDSSRLFYYQIEFLIIKSIQLSILYLIYKRKLIAYLIINNINQLVHVLISLFRSCVISTMHRKTTITTQSCQHEVPVYNNRQLVNKMILIITIKLPSLAIYVSRQKKNERLKHGEKEHRCTICICCINITFEKKNNAQTKA